MPGLDACVRNHDAATGEHDTGFLARRLFAADGTARYLPPGGFGQRQGFSRHDFGDRPAAAICLGPKSPRGHAGVIDLSATLRRKASFKLSGSVLGSLAMRSPAGP